MTWPQPASPLLRRRLNSTVAAAMLVLVTGCAEGDFGRIRSSLVTDNIHSWVGSEATGTVGIPWTSQFTDDERQLRDLAYPLIEPPFSRQRWFSILGEYGINRSFRQDWWYFDHTVYGHTLMTKPYRSPTARYAQVIEDIRNDTVRLLPFFATAGRVINMDQKREQSLPYITQLSAEEREGALARINENRLVITWVHHSLTERAAAYQHALERLVVAFPSDMAVEAERALNQLRAQIGQYQAMASAPVPAHAERRAAGSWTLAAEK